MREEIKLKFANLAILFSYLPDLKGSTDISTGVSGIPLTDIYDLPKASSIQSWVFIIFACFFLKLVLWVELKEANFNRSAPCFFIFSPVGQKCFRIETKDDMQFKSIISKYWVWISVKNPGLLFPMRSEAQIRLKELWKVNSRWSSLWLVRF